jgi:hypothetical protein
LRSRLVIPAALLVAAAYMKGRWDACPAPGPEPAGAAPSPGARASAALAETAATLAPAPAPPPAPAPAPAPPPAPAPADRGLDLAGLAEWSAQPAAAPARRGPALAPGDRDLDRLSEWIGAPAARLVPAGVPEEPELAGLAEWAAPVAPATAPAPGRHRYSVAPSVIERGRFSLGGWAAGAGHLAVCGVSFRERLEVPVDAGAVRLVVEVGDNVAEGGLVVPSDPGFAPDEEGFTLILAAAGPGVFAAVGRYEVLRA